MVSCLFCRKKVWHERSLSSAPKAKERINTYYCPRCNIYLVVRRYDSVTKKEGKIDSIVTADVMSKASDVTKRRVFKR